LDAVGGSALYRESLAAAINTLADPDATPSARVLAAMAQRHENSYTVFVLAQSRAHRATLQNMQLDETVARRFEAMAAESIASQRKMEAADTLPFEAWRQRYLSAEMIRP
jgi:glutamate--cysteine ligase